MRKHSTSQLCCLCCLCAKAQKAGICLGVVVGGVSIYPQSLQKKTSPNPKWAKNPLRLKAPSQRSPSHLEQSEELLCSVCGRSVDLKSHAFPISPLTMSGTKIMHLSIVLDCWLSRIHGLDNLKQNDIMATSGNMFNKTCCWGSKQELHTMDELSDRAARRFARPPNQSVKCQRVRFMFLCCFLSKRSTRFTLWMVNTDCCERFGNYQQFWNTNPFQNVEGFVQERSTFFTSWIMPLQLMVRCCGCERRAKPGIHSTFKIISFPFQNSQLLDILHITKLLAPPHRSPAPCPDPASLQKWYPPPALAMNHNERHHPDQIFWM